MSNKKPLAKVFHFDLYGKREDKYNFLNKNSLESIEWTELPNTAPNYFMVQKDFEAEKSYKKGFAINELFALSSVGIVTGKDALYVDDNKKKLLERIEEYYGQADEKLVKKIAYRPFDIRYLYNNIKLIERNRFRVMKHFIAGENVGLVTVRRIKTGKNIGFFITNKIGDDTLSGMSSSCICPLYIYPQTTNQKTIDQSTKRTPK